MSEVLLHQSMISKWTIFAKERFPLASHIPMVVLFVGTIAVYFAEEFTFKSLFPFIATFIFFFKLRLFDEIKDFELDKKINPQRPLPRGLLNVKNLEHGIILCIIAEVILFGIYGYFALLLALITIMYSLLMYKEFFIGNYIRPHLTTYAISHTVITVPLSLTITQTLSNTSLFNQSLDIVYLSLANWCFFNIFEFGRKTFLKDEEREGVESYSKIFKPFGAYLLVQTMSFLALFFIFYIEKSMSLAIKFLIVSNLILAVIGFSYVLIHNNSWGKIYRAFSSGFIILAYIGICAIKLFL